MEKAFLSGKKGSIVARIKSHGNHFEILVNADKALEMKKTGKGNIMNVLESTGVFSDMKKGIKVSDSDLDESFGTTDLYKIAEKIVKDGELQLPSAYKEKAREQKHKQIVDWLSVSCSDANNLPYPPERIKNAIEQAGANIDENKPVEEQAMSILKLIQKIMPIKIAMKRIALRVPSIHTGKIYGYLKDFILREEWLSDGSLSCTIEIPAKMQSDFYDKLNSITHGEAITKEM
jgi:ribosome maturation protein SDO1